MTSVSSIRPQQASVHRFASHRSPGVILWLFAAMGCATVVPGTSFGAEDDEVPAPDIEQHVAPVIVDGRTLFSVRGVISMPAERRAKRIEYNIVRAASNPAVSPDDIRLVKGKEKAKIVAGDMTLTLVLDEDGAVQSRAEHRPYPPRGDHPHEHTGEYREIPI